jgi:hypothetical protein
VSTTVDFLEVCNAVVGLTISGVTVTSKWYDASGLMVKTLAPLPFPKFITNIKVARETLDKKLDRIEYDMNWRYIHVAASGGMGGLASAHSGLVAAMQCVINAFCTDAILDGAMDNGMPTILNAGLVYDNAGSAYLGFDISIHVMQYLNPINQLLSPINVTLESGDILQLEQ